MPAWLIAALIQYVLPAILEDLVKAGMVSAATALAVKYGARFELMVSQLKVEYSYPGDAKTPAATNNLNLVQPVRNNETETSLFP